MWDTLPVQVSKAGEIRVRQGYRQEHSSKQKAKNIYFHPYYEAVNRFSSTSKALKVAHPLPQVWKGPWHTLASNNPNARDWFPRWLLQPVASAKKKGQLVLLWT